VSWIGKLRNLAHPGAGCRIGQVALPGRKRKEAGRNLERVGMGRPTWGIAQAMERIRSEAGKGKRAQGSSEACGRLARSG
jgi:hypothetical protein